MDDLFCSHVLSSKLNSVEKVLYIVWCESEQKYVYRSIVKNRYPSKKDEYTKEKLLTKSLKENTIKKRSIFVVL